MLKLIAIGAVAIGGVAAIGAGALLMHERSGEFSVTDVVSNAFDAGFNTGVAVAQEVRAPEVVPDQNADWVSSLLQAADELGVLYDAACVEAMRDHVIVRGFVRGAVLRDGRFLIRDVYGEDSWFCG